MKVLITKEVFDNAKTQEEQLELKYLLHIIWYRSRYTLLLRDDVSDCQIVRQMTCNERDIINFSLVHTITESLNPDCTISIDDVDDKTLKIFTQTEGIKYLLQPLSIIVENSYNDSRFIKAIMRCFDVSREFKRNDDERWLQFENAGGCGNVLNFLKARLAYFQNSPKFFRCYVILDGDKHYSEEIINKYNDLKKSLDKWGVTFHILEKRCMENYVPIEAIAENNHTRGWINAYRYLTPEQRDFLNIGSGFFGDLTKEQKRKVQKQKKSRREYYIRKQLNKHVRNLYSSVSDANFSYLSNGLNLPSFKDTFPAYFDDYVHVYKRNLKQLTSHQSNPNELEDIMNDIIKLL